MRRRPLEVGRASGGQPLSWAERANEWKAGRDVAPPGGESLESTGRRVAELVRELAMKHSRGAFILVAHGEVIGVPPARRYPFDLEYGSISAVEWRAAAPTALRRRGFVPD